MKMAKSLALLKCINENLLTFSLWVKFKVGDLHLMQLNDSELHGNLYNRSHVFTYGYI